MYSMYREVSNVNDEPETPKFNPYSSNGGSIVAIAGEDFAIIASDTRLSTSLSISTRDQTKLFRLTDRSVLGCTGCWCDTLTVTRVVGARIEMYLDENLKAMATPSIAQMLSTMLYYKRFFPYLVVSVLAGLDCEGRGCVYSFDPIGHVERLMFKASGTAGPLLQPLLDNQVGHLNMENLGVTTPVSEKRALCLIKDVFISATERDIYTGDKIHINIMNKDGIQEEWFGLRRD